MTTTTHYNGTAVIEFDDKDHVYRLGDRIIPGVTGILSVINKPALVPWAAKLTAEAYTAALKDLREPLSATNLAAIEKAAKAAPRAKKTGAADRGVLIHDWCENFAKGITLPIPPDEGVEKAIDAFLNWVGVHKVEFIETEFRVYSRVFNFCGTVDFIANVDGERVLGDYKTGSGIYPEYHFQTAAYLEAYMEEHGGDILPRLIVQFNKDNGAFKPVMRTVKQFPNDFQGFRGACLLSDALKGASNGNA